MPPPATPQDVAGRLFADLTYFTGAPTPDEVRRVVQQNPQSFIALMRSNPAFAASLRASYTPQQLSSMFSDIGFSQGDANPAPQQRPSSTGQTTPETPEMPMMQAGLGASAAPGMMPTTGTFAFGGLVDEPGYYQRGGAPALGLPQMASAFKQAHFSGLNLKAAIPKPPGMHLIQSGVPGRTDRIPMRARTGSYILPADVVSGLGQGNTMAGARMWGQMIGHSIGPMGIQNAIKARAFKAAPLRMRVPGPGTKGSFADGGTIDGDEYTPIVTAGGEVVVDPEIVHELGWGDPEEGKRILASATMNVRKHTIQHTKTLPRPVE
jgi:hypothetical protein